MPYSEMIAKMRLALPNFIVLQPVDKIDYLGYIHEGGDHDGYLRFMEPQAASPYAKFEIEFSASNDFVHIRSCQNNKYWERKQILSISGGYWVTATADKKEDDQSKESCTLFKVTSVDHAMNTVRIMHVQSGCYLCCWRWDSEKYTRGMYSFYTTHDQNGFDIFKFIDWNSLLILPRFVAFKGYNNKYLCLRRVEWDLPYMQFSSDDIGDSTVALEIFPTDDGYVRIKPVCTDKFWRRSPNWIWADSNDSSSKNTDTVFRPVRSDNKTIGLINLGNNAFCKSLTTEGKSDCLNAATYSLTKEARLIVEEPVLSREIYGVKYHLGNSRVYGEIVLIVAKNSASNFSNEPATLDVKLSYTDIKTTNWKNSFSLKLGTKATMDFNIPLIFEGKVELSGEVQTGIDWGETNTTTTVVDVVYKVTVPPRTKVIVCIIATKGMCDVPFTYMQRDTLYDGTSVTNEIQGGTYTGSNYYSTNFEAKEEALE
ncbi:uncharacterized protein LOC128039700 [Gossypium raimondii]|uniref:Agglutinin domain-containing protein n=1 Tax=Gossypium raimondii TaxID=29730 RepID=A0A0D2N730_GOSRA|nr:uncharacterized protein LOC128039700 [Gossypium raimondii]KJB28032.1 hypothetical protein B456_005G023100 [Gossypium raimondii]MBA0585159.1 hypothetical protein [Gossypium raimondii]